MPLTAGIVGLPNVGKSTLFNAITKAGALAANYPFATIDPNVGVVEVPDERLEKLAKIINPQKVIPTTFEFTDIAGLVRGASKGEGLGNQFLSHIREVDAITQVVRCFDDGDITHVDGTIDPVRDIETINLELIFSDIEVIEKRLPKIEKKAQLKVDQEAVDEYNILKDIYETLLKNQPIRSMNIADTDKKIIKNFNFLTQKPILYVCNVSEDEISDYSQNEYVKKVMDVAKIENAEVAVISAKIESELSELDDDEKAMFLEDLGIIESGLDILVRKSYDLLGLKTYFTAGVKEVRAWTFKDGYTAPQCAGIIHTDFEKGFIRAETISYDDFITYNGESGAKEHGKARLEGKDYLVKDGDVMHFRFNV